MKILTIMGSPRKKGNTAAVLSAFEELAEGTHQVERINIRDVKVAGCLGCDRCFQVSDKPGCSQRDDGNPILERVLDADLIVYASPVYCWSYTAQLKALMDRHYCLVKWKDGVSRSLEPGKPAMLLLTCGGGALNNADLVQEEFKREIAYLEWRSAGMYVVDNTTTPAELGDRRSATARAMLADLVGIEVGT